LSNVRSLLSHHFVVLLVVLDLSGQLFDLQVLHLQLSLEIAVEASIEAAAHGVLLDLDLVLLDLLFEGMALFLLIIDLLKKVDILTHDLRVFLLVDILVLLEHLSEIVDVVLQVPSLVGVLSVEISVAGFILHLLQDVLFVETNDTSLELLEVVVDKSEIALGLHTLIDDLGEFLLVLVLEDIDFVPSVTLDLLSLLLVLLHHQLDLLLEPIGLVGLPVQLDPLILLQLLDDLLVMQTELIESLLELSRVLVLLGLEFVEPLKICVHLFGVVLPSSFHLDLVGLLHLVDLILVHSLHVLLGLQQLFVSVVVLNLFVLDF